MQPGISVIIPAYNEEDNLARAIADTRAALAALAADFEIIVVDDGSTDRTFSIAEREAAGHGEVRAIRHAENQGFGGAVLTGIAAARKELITYNSADSQFDIKELGRLLSAADNADVVLGYRSSRSDYSLYRRMNSAIFMRLMRLLFGVPFRDINWVHLYRRDIFSRVHVRSRGIFFCGEIVVRACRSGYRFAEVETSYHPRAGGKARGGRVGAVAKTFLDMMRTWWQIRVRGHEVVSG
ncbi:MAG: glycosyltransferase family 2 protein [Chloroflexi bacterium]|nr:glycosyltransferase family 2 protein [Chloroflexota bacterium]